MSGSSLEGKAFLRSHKTLNSKAFSKSAAQNPDLLSLLSGVGTNFGLGGLRCTGRDGVRVI